MEASKINKKIVPIKAVTKRFKYKNSFKKLISNNLGGNQKGMLTAYGTTM